MPNKEGGYAANFTPTAAVDVSSDMIVDCEVIADPNEHTQTLATVDRIEENFGKKPEAFLADTAHGTGENLAGMQQRNVTFLHADGIVAAAGGQSGAAGRSDATGGRGGLAAVAA